MPDSTDVFYAQCHHDGSTAEGASAAERVASAVGEVMPVAVGILHVGANVANEAGGYARCVGGRGANVLFVECDPEVAKACATSARRHGQRCINACLSDGNREDVQFFQSEANGGMSSSLRRFEEHKNIFPGVEHSASSPVRTWRYDDLVATLPAGLVPEMNVILIDAQGMEYEIVSGMTKALRAPGPGSGGRGFDVAVVEVSHVPVYEGQRLGPDVDALMASLGFKCRAHCEPCDHCDRLYRRVGEEAAQAQVVDVPPY